MWGLEVSALWSIYCPFLPHRTLCRPSQDKCVTGYFKNNFLPKGKCSWYSCTHFKIRNSEKYRSEKLKNCQRLNFQISEISVTTKQSPKWTFSREPPKPFRETLGVRKSHFGNHETFQFRFVMCTSDTARNFNSAFYLANKFWCIICTDFEKLPQKPAVSPSIHMLPIGFWMIFYCALHKNLCKELHFLHWRWKRYVHPKRCEARIIVFVVITHKATIVNEMLVYIRQKTHFIWSTDSMFLPETAQRMTYLYGPKHAAHKTAAFQYILCGEYWMMK